MRLTGARFEQLVEEVLAELPVRYRKLLENVVIIVENQPRSGRRGRKPEPDDNLLLGEFVGVPRTEKSVFEPGPPQPSNPKVAGSNQIAVENPRNFLGRRCLELHTVD